MPISIFAVLSHLLLIGSARAQISAPNCTDSSLLGWTFNALHQSPCLVSAYLGAVCNKLVTASNVTDSDNICKCNTVTYNLVCACDACQASLSLPNVGISEWAYFNVYVNRVTLGHLRGGIEAASIGVTSTAIVPTSTSKGVNSTSSMPSSLTASSPIAGGVAGGVIGAASIVGLWFIVCRRRARTVPFAPYMYFQGGKKVQPPTKNQNYTRVIPSDPTTYPGYLPASDQHLGSTGRLQPTEIGYSGLPEIWS
ncbi:hypothetical protein EI94DRAFT_1746688 [Lactarius quietus]|nr:hypothetical protein EI94DRAFT_1746688 [Lactarius quietus]